jgi:hypothetical protein
VNATPIIITGLPLLKRIVKDAARRAKPNKNKINEIKKMVSIDKLIHEKDEFISSLKKHIDIKK